MRFFSILTLLLATGASLVSGAERAMVSGAERPASLKVHLRLTLLDEFSEEVFTHVYDAPYLGTKWTEEFGELDRGFGTVEDALGKLRAAAPQFFIVERRYDMMSDRLRVLDSSSPGVPVLVDSLYKELGELAHDRAKGLVHLTVEILQEESPQITALHLFLGEVLRLARPRSTHSRSRTAFLPRDEEDSNEHIVQKLAKFAKSDRFRRMVDEASPGRASYPEGVPPPYIALFGRSTKTTPPSREKCWHEAKGEGVVFDVPRLLGEENSWKKARLSLLPWGWEGSAITRDYRGGFPIVVTSKSRVFSRSAGQDQEVGEGSDYHVEIEPIQGFRSPERVWKGPGSEGQMRFRHVAQALEQLHLRQRVCAVPPCCTACSDWERVRDIAITRSQNDGDIFVHVSCDNANPFKGGDVCRALFS